MLSNILKCFLPSSTETCCVELLIMSTGEALLYLSYRNMAGLSLAFFFMLSFSKQVVWCSFHFLIIGYNHFVPFCFSYFISSLAYLKWFLFFIFTAVFQIHILTNDLWGFHSEIEVVILMTQRNKRIERQLCPNEGRWFFICGTVLI